MSEPRLTGTPGAPSAATARPEVVTRRLPDARPAWVQRATSADHKSVGLLYIGTALVFAALAVVELALLRVQLIAPENAIIAPEVFNRLLSVTGTTAVVLFAIPLALGLIGYLVPLQIGARGVALPRLNLLSYWLYAAGAVTIYATFLYVPPDAGVASLPPLSDAAFSPSNGVDAWITGVGLATTGFILFAVNLVATVNGMRAPGLAWRRMPPFSWAATASAYLLLVVGAAMLAALVMLFIDRNFGGVFFAAGEGGAPLLYEHLASIYFTGAWAIVVVVGAAIISEILPTFAGKPLFSHRGTVAALLAIAVIAPFAWIQSMYEAPLGSAWPIAAMILALVLAVPVGTLLFIWIATLWGGAIHLRAAPLYCVAAISTLTFGLAAELSHAVVPVGWLLDNTAAAEAATVYVLVGGAVMGGFAALHYWFAKLSGRLLGEGLGKLALGLMVIGVHAFCLPMLLAGLEGQPVNVFQYYEGAGLAGYNLVASLGAFVLAAGVLVGLANVAYSYANGPQAPPDPWGGATLEWFALSPPSVHNFDVVPDVRSAEPMREIREAVLARTTFAAQASPEGGGRHEPEPATESRADESPVA